MNTKLSQIFKEISQIEPRDLLADLILEKIDLEKTRQMRRKLAFSYAGLASSLAAGVWAIVGLGSAILRSEFWSILSLIFSDARIVVGSWKTYLYSLMETLPVADIIIVLAPVFGLLMFFNWLASLKRDKIVYRNINFHALQH